jgi:WD40 repeat protein
VGIQSVCYSKDGNKFYSGCGDGSLQIFSVKHNHHRPELMVRKAHESHEDYSSIISFEDNFKLATRHTDGTLKVWDLRAFSKPILHDRDLPNRFPGNKMCLSPDGRYFLVGTAVGKDIEETNSYVHFYDTSSLKRLKTLTIGNSSVCGLCWSPAINQIIVGKANGEAHIFLDDKLSKMGALKAYQKEPRVDKDPKLGYTAPVYLPHSLPLYKETLTNNPKKAKLEIRKNPLKSERPMFPMQGPHKNGRQNEKAYTLIQNVIQSLAANPEKVVDARKPLWELQKYTKEKQEYTSAYQFTQPQQMLGEVPLDTKEFQFLQTI